MNGVRNKVARHYDEVAEIYDRRYDRSRGRSYYSHISRHVLACLPKGRNLLDLGCGTGLFVQHYTGQGGKATGLDLSRGMIVRARSRCGGSQFAVGTAEVLPFRDGCFDAVASLLAFSYVHEPEKMLQEVYRVLRPGGSIAVCTLGRNLLTSVLPAVYTLGEAMRIRHVGMGAFRERYYTVDEMEELFLDAGFEGLLIRRCTFAHLNLIDPLYDIARRLEPFVEENIPQLAYNILASGKKPED